MNSGKKNEWIQTYTDKKFYAFDPKPEQICIEDIAHALSNVCRFSGHCNRFYSVAEHSWIMAEEMIHEYDATDDEIMWCLLHDASEAYIQDIPAPFKRFFPDYKECEDRIMKAVANKFGLSYPIPKAVKKLDIGILKTEREQLFDITHPKTFAMEDIWGIERVDVEPIDRKISCWVSEAAEVNFLEMYETVCGFVEEKFSIKEVR